ncbi:MAG TPA: purine-nucleoside phosphorylase [Tenericutes bacterium]|nr:purine-nucleoside phosphorylase [Mycoplasmatota bacterium]
MTPHIEALKEDIANIVIMPGDPKRAKYIAENYLTNYKLINEVRSMFGYTGFYKDKKVTVMASGMGMPSMGIYSYELFKFYDVDIIIRIGSCGSYTDKLNIFDVILTDSVYSDSSYAKVQNNFTDNILHPSLEVNNIIEKTALENNIKIHKERIYCSDVFYKEKDDFVNKYETLNCVGVEMESFALFHNANILNKKAACILTVSDSLVTKEATTSQQREKSLNDMIKLALESALLIN